MSKDGQRTPGPITYEDEAFNMLQAILSQFLGDAPGTMGAKLLHSLIKRTSIYQEWAPALDGVMYSDASRYGTAQALVDKQLRNRAEDAADHYMLAQQRDTFSDLMKLRTSYKAFSENKNLTTMYGEGEAGYQRYITSEVDNIYSNKILSFGLKLLNAEDAKETAGNIASLTAKIAKSGQYMANGKTLEATSKAVLFGERMFRDEFGAYDFKPTDYSGFNVKAVSKLMNASLTNSDLTELANIDITKGADISSAVTRFKSKVKAITAAIEPLKDIFGNDMQALLQAMQKFAGQTIQQMSPDTLSKVTRQIMNNVHAGNFTIEEFAASSSQMRAAFAHESVFNPAVRLFGDLPTNIAVNNAMLDLSGIEIAKTDDFKALQGREWIRIAQSQDANNVNKAYAIWADKRQQADPNADISYDTFTKDLRKNNYYSGVWQDEVHALLKVADVKTLGDLSQGQTSTHYMEATRYGYGTSAKADQRSSEVWRRAQLQVLDSGRLARSMTDVSDQDLAEAFTYVRQASQEGQRFTTKLQNTPEVTKEIDTWLQNTKPELNAAERKSKVDQMQRVIRFIQTDTDGNKALLWDAGVKNTRVAQERSATAAKMQTAMDTLRSVAYSDTVMGSLQGNLKDAVATVNTTKNGEYSFKSILSTALKKDSLLIEVFTKAGLSKSEIDTVSQISDAIAIQNTVEQSVATDKELQYILSMDNSAKDDKGNSKAQRMEAWLKANSQTLQANRLAAVSGFVKGDYSSNINITKAYAVLKKFNEAQASGKSPKATKLDNSLGLFTDEEISSYNKNPDTMSADEIKQRYTQYIVRLSGLDKDAQDKVEALRQKDPERYRSLLQLKEPNKGRLTSAEVNAATLSHAFDQDNQYTNDNGKSVKQRGLEILRSGDRSVTSEDIQETVFSRLKKNGKAALPEIQKLLKDTLEQAQTPAAKQKVAEIMQQVNDAYSVTGANTDISAIAGSILNILTGIFTNTEQTAKNTAKDGNSGRAGTSTNPPSNAMQTIINQWATNMAKQDETHAASSIPGSRYAPIA